MTISASIWLIVVQFQKAMAIYSHSANGQVQLLVVLDILIVPPQAISRVTWGYPVKAAKKVAQAPGGPQKMIGITTD